MLSQPITIKQVVPVLWPTWRKVFFYGLFINLLVLAPSWYMLEVYDRVINSRNLTTLIMLTVLVAFLYFVMESLERVRKHMLFSASQVFQHVLQERLFNAAFAARCKNPQFPVQQVFTDFSTFKNMLYSPALIGLTDLPFGFIFLVAIFLIHPALGVMTCIGLLIQVAVTLANQIRVNPQMQQANLHAMEAQRYFNSVFRQSDVVQAMGMLVPIEKKWLRSQQAFLLKQALASELAGKNAATSKFLQTLQGSLILGLACFLMINGQLVNGGAMMIVASILAARVLAPLVQLVTQWKSLAQAKEAYIRLESLLQSFQATVQKMEPPPPTGELTVENMSFALPNAGKGQQQMFLKNLQFKLSVGEVLVVAGSSASGKTTLSRLLAGLVPATSGKVTYDGFDVYAWDKNSLGQHIGYMPQQVDLLDGTVAENITRFGPVDQSKLATVVEQLGMQELIKKLPQGFNTQIGSEGAFLSGGQRQMIGLARAIYGDPSIVILDEPNANLDTAGEKNLHQMISIRKKQGTTFVVISHLQSIIGVADYLLILAQGQMLRFGKPAEVMASLQAAQTKAVAR